MRKRKSEDQWLELVKIYRASGLNLTAWCREKGISKSSFYPYLKKFNFTAEPHEQEWGSIHMPNGMDTSSIMLKVGSISLDIKPSFHKETLADVLRVILNLC